MLSNTQPSMSALVSIILNELLCPAPLEGGQSCLGGLWTRESQLKGVTSGIWGQVHVLLVICQAYGNPGVLTGTSCIFCVAGTAF